MLLLTAKDSRNSYDIYLCMWKSEVTWSFKGAEATMDFLGAASSTDWKLDWKPGNDEETYLAVILVIVPGPHCGCGRDRCCVSSGAGYTPWRTCVASCCRTFEQLHKQQTTSLYFLYFTAVIFSLYLGMSVHDGQKADNQCGLSVFGQKIVRFRFLGHNTGEFHLGHCGGKEQHP